MQISLVVQLLIEIRQKQLHRHALTNVSECRTRHLDTLRGLVLDSDILAVSGAVTAQAPYAVGDALLRRPRHQGSIDASWTRGGGAAFLQVIVRGTALDAEPSFGPSGGLYQNPGHAVANLGGSWKPVRSVELFARVLNLFDRGYEEVLGYPAPGRTAFAGARLAVGR